MADKKERIARRMIRSASKLWGHKGPQAEESFDPIVGLLLGSYASELEKIHHELSDSETRIIKRLVEIFTPEPIISVKPSHAIAYAYPEKETVSIDNNFLIFYNKKKGSGTSNKKNEKPVFFTPTSKINLLQASVKYFAARDTIFECQNYNVKDPLIESDNNDELRQNSIWIGFDFNNLNELPESLCLYFNVFGSDLKTNFINKQLANASWYYDNSEISVSEGFLPSDLETKSLVDNLVDKNANVSSKVIDHINSYYKKDFRTIDLSSIKNKAAESDLKIPDGFSEVFDEKEVQKIEKESIFWLEVRFPQILSIELIESINLSLNSFPVLNRKLNEFSSSARKLLNIIPLQTDDIFLDLENVYNKNGKPYNINLYSNINELENGYAVLRYGGVNRYDSRDAKQHIDNLIELLKDESTAFNILGSDMITSDLKKLDQAIARLEKKAQEINLIQSETNYLLLKPYLKNDLVYVEFWTSDGVFGNGIKTGSKLQIYKGKDVKADSIETITTTIGGSDKPGTADIINIYRKALLTEGRLVTEADYKAMCYEYFGEDLNAVDVTKGTMTDSNASSGLLRTIDIKINLKNIDKFKKTDLGFFIRDLQIILEKNSSNVFPYRIFFS